MKNKIKLVMSDIDGTLINEDHVISEKTRKTVHRLLDQGYEFGIATGRNPESARGIATQLDLNPDLIPIVSLNGLQVDDSKYDYHRFDVSMDYKICQSLGALGEKYYMGVLYFFENEVFFHMDDLSVQDFESNAEEDQLRFFKNNIKMQRIRDISEIKSKFEAGEHILKMVYIQNDDYTELVKERLSKEFPEDYDLLMVAGGWAEIMPKSVNKGQAIADYCEFRGIEMSEVLSFGDSDNDLTMIHKSGVGVAMENARNSLKVMADKKTKSNVEDGVAVFLETYLLD
ncbi:Cof-type HAD-IIB family hydrolase [Erysipelothrix urinaevulpis]|uniref:Cof-type HAD-IIB family hydrolase n=1 Tax=Erysipelothrix urinaevulpis TaxID=2683717 RepID=UPI001359D245|nr:Cof-type HAD-IIB family hydrolase [Erysipelothrix urinaevulpis]